MPSVPSPPRVSRWLAFGWLACAASPLFAAPEFAGLLVDGGVVHVILGDTVTGDQSGWLRLGQRHGDYTVTDFNAARLELSLRRGEETLTLPLKSGKLVTGGDPKAKPNLSLSINLEGSILFPSDPLPVDYLRAQFAAAAARQPALPVTVMIGEAADLSRLKQVLDLLRESGLTKFTVRIRD